MFIKKILKDNRAYGTQNWAIMIMLTFICTSGLIDLCLLFVAKNDLNNVVSWLAEVGTYQGGFCSSAPYGWDAIMGSSSKYVTAGEAANSFYSAFGNLQCVSNRSISGISQVPYHSEGRITGEAVYNPPFCKKIFGTQYTMSRTAGFVGFWHYRYSGF